MPHGIRLTVIAFLLSAAGTVVAPPPAASAQPGGTAADGRLAAGAQANTPRGQALRAELRGLTARLLAQRQAADGDPQAIRELRAERRRLLRELAAVRRGAAAADAPRRHTPPPRATDPPAAGPAATPAPVAPRADAAPNIDVPDTPRIAVLPAGDGPAVAVAVAGLEAALSADGRWALVDRSAFDAVLTEQRLQKALAADTADARRDAFAVLDADLVLTVTAAGRAAVIHAASGLQTARLRARADAHPDAAPAQIVAELHRHLSQPARRLRVVALPPAVDDRLVPAGDGLGLRLGDALRSALIDRGAVLIDFGVAQALDRERVIRGDRALTPIGRPWFVRARISADPAAPDDVAVHVALQAGGRAVHAATWTAAFDDALPAFADAVAEAVSADAAAEIAVDLDELAAQISELRAAGQPQAALDVAETLLLYRPDDAALRDVAMDLLRELIRRTLKVTAPDASDAARMAAVAVRFTSLCRHAEVVLARPAPPNAGDGGNAHRATQLEGYNALPVVLRELVKHRWGRASLSHPSELPEPLKTQVGEPYHRLLRQHARRMLAASQRQAPPRFRSTVAAVHHARDDVLVDDALMDLRAALWERLLLIPAPNDTPASLSDSLPARPQTVPQRRSLIAALDRARDAGGFVDHPLAFEAIRARLARASVARAEVFAPMVPNVTPDRLGIGRPPAAAPTDAADAAARADAPPGAGVLPTIAMKRLEVLPPRRADHSAGTPAAQHRREIPYWAGLLRCGEHGDLIYNARQVVLIRPDGSLARQYLLPGEKPGPGLGIAEPAYDGRHLWVAVRDAETRLLRIDPATGAAAAVTTPQPLPPSDRGVAVAVLAPGRLFVAGAFERDGGLRSWGLTVTADNGGGGGGGAAEVETVFAVNSSFAAENGTAVKAMPVGRARVIRSEGPEPVTWVALEHGGLQLIDPATKTMFRNMRELRGGFDQLTFTDRQIVADSGDKHGTWVLTAGEARGVRSRRHFEMPRGNRPFWSDGWEMRVDGRPGHEVLYASPNPALALQPLARLSRAERPGEHIPGAGDAHGLVSPHQGLILLLGGAIRTGRLPDDLHARFADAVAPEVEQTRRAGGQAFAVIEQPAVRVFTFDQAVVAVDRLGHRLPAGPAELDALKATQGRYTPGRWINFSSDRRGEITADDLQPPTTGRYGVAQRRDGTLEGRERTAVAEVYAPVSEAAVRAIAAKTRADRVAARAASKTSKTAQTPTTRAHPGAGGAPHTAPAGPRATGAAPAPITPPVLQLAPPTDGAPRPPRGVPDTVRAGLSIAVTELTQLQYLRVTAPDKAHGLSPGRALIAAWTPQALKATEALAFCAALRKQTGKNWRLPTEAEWEYAAGLPDLESSLARWASAPGTPGSAGGPHRVAAHGPDRRGLFDLRGNLAEWTDAVYEYDTGDTRPRRPDDRRPVLIERGGAWFDAPSRCTAQARRPGLDRAGVRLVVDTGGPEGGDRPGPSRSPPGVGPAVQPMHRKQRPPRVMAQQQHRPGVGVADKRTPLMIGFHRVLDSVPIHQPQLARLQQGQRVGAQRRGGPRVRVQAIGPGRVQGRQRDLDQPGAVFGQNKHVGGAVGRRPGQQRPVRNTRQQKTGEQPEAGEGFDRLRVIGAARKNPRQVRAIIRRNPQPEPPPRWVADHRRHRKGLPA